MGIIGGFWTDDPSGKHQQRYWDGHTWASHVSDFGFTSRDPLPGGSAYPPPLQSSAGAVDEAPDLPPAVDPPAAPERRRLVVGIPAHVVASLVTAGGWLVVLPVIALWRRGSRPLAATWVATVVLIVAATTALLNGRVPEAAHLQAAYADDGSVPAAGPPLVVAEGTGAVDPAAPPRPLPPPAGRSYDRLAARPATAVDLVTAQRAEVAAAPAAVPADPTTPPVTSTAATGTEPAEPAPADTGPTSPVPPSDWTGGGSASPPVMTPGVTPGATPSSPATGAPASTPGQEPTPAAEYRDCASLNLDHPHGVGSPGSVDLVPAGATPVTSFGVDQLLYVANAGLDSDADSIACELA